MYIIFVTGAIRDGAVHNAGNELRQRVKKFGGLYGGRCGPKLIDDFGGQNQRVSTDMPGGVIVNIWGCANRFLIFGNVAINTST